MSEAEPLPRASFIEEQTIIREGTDREVALTILCLRVTPLNVAKALNFSDVIARWAHENQHAFSWDECSELAFRLLKAIDGWSEMEHEFKERREQYRALVERRTDPTE